MVQLQYVWVRKDMKGHGREGVLCGGLHQIMSRESLECSTEGLMSSISRGLMA